MKKEPINIRWRSEPQKYNKIQINASSIWVFNKINDSLDDAPLPFTFEGGDADWSVNSIAYTEINNGTSKLLDFSISKTNSIYSNDTSETDVDGKSLGDPEVILTDIGENVCHICFPRTNLQFENFYVNLLLRITQLWPDTKRQASPYLGIPTGGSFEEIYTKLIFTHPFEIINFCYLNFPNLDGSISYKFNFGGDTLEIISELSVDYLIPDNDIPYWEFLVLSEDTIPNDIKDGYEQVQLRGLRNIAVRLIIVEEGEGAEIHLQINRNLPIRPFFPGDKSKIEGAADLIKLDYPYNRQVKKLISQLDELHKVSSKMYVEKLLEKRKGKPGRPHIPEDIWAWEQVFIECRPQKDVYSDWVEKVSNNPNRKHNVQNDRQFKRIMKPGWR